MDGFTCSKATRIFLITFLIPVVVEASCDGEHQYLDASGNCQHCERCPAGFEPTAYHCGYGTKDHRYTCKKCDEGSYSSTNDYKFCKTCSPCTRWHADVLFECSATSDATCGKCYRGYFRPQKSDGNSDVECHKCNGSTVPSCQLVDWQMIAIVSFALGGVIVVLVLVCVCCWLKRKSPRHAKNERCESSNIPVKSKRHIGLFQIVTCNSDTVTSSSLEPLTPRSLDEETFKRPDNIRPLCDDPTTYSNLPTAEFVQHPAPHPHYPHLPTDQFLTDPYYNSRRGNGIIPPEIGNFPNNPAITNRHDDSLPFQVEAFETESITKPMSTYQQNEH